MSSPDSVEEQLASIRKRASQQVRRVFFPEQDDKRVQVALQEIVAQGICTPLVFNAGPGTEGCEILSEQVDAAQWRERAAVTYASRMAYKGLDIDSAREQLRDPLLLGAALVRCGYADCGVAGSVASSADVVRASLRGIGLAETSTLVSSAFLMEHPYRVMTFGDCGVNPRPDARQLAHIAVDSARTHHVLTGEDPVVAMLSFSTMGSAEHEELHRIREAVIIARELQPSLSIDGELQADTALIPDVGVVKAPDSTVAGLANVLIFPDLNSGNIAYKLVQRLGGAKAIGPVLQGLACPWLDLSRGCSSEDIVNAAAIASVLASVS